MRVRIPNNAATRSVLILTLGGVGGLLFWRIGTPAPFMLGAMLTCWLAGITFPALRPWLSFPWPVRFGFVAAVGLVMGSYATPLAVAGIPGWWPSLLMLVVVSLGIAWLTYGYLKWRGYDEPVAWFAAQPAGLSEIVTMSARYTDKDYLVALFHLVRVSTVFLVAPLVVWIAASDFDPRTMPAGQRHLWQVAWWMWPLYAAVGLAGFWGGKLVRLPMSMLLGPMLLTALLAGSGAVEFQRPFEAICLIQITMGGSIGARMGQVRFGALRRAVPDAYVVAIGMIGLAFVGGWLLSIWTGAPLLKVFLAIAPGGVSELSLIAVAMGYEVAFVTLHHLFRMFVVMAALPFKRLTQNQD